MVRVRILFGVRFRVRVSVSVWVSVNFLRDSYSVLLRPQHHSTLTTAGRVHTAEHITLFRYISVAAVTIGPVKAAKKSQKRVPS